MKKLLLQEKYPVAITDIAKSETTCQNVADVVTYLEAVIAENPKVQRIGVFDHHAHTRAIGGEINPSILAAVNLLFCFGPSLPSAQMLALRPRSIGIADLGDRFVVTFMEAPIDAANVAMKAWVKGLRNKV